MNILVVDDSDVMRKTVIRFLVTLGIPQENIHFACNGDEAVKLVQRLEPVYDLIYMDESMPVMTGSEATMMIRELERSMEIPESIIFTCSTSVTTPIPGTNIALEKPIHKEHLANLLRQVQEDPESLRRKRTPMGYPKDGAEGFSSTALSPGSPYCPGRLFTDRVTSGGRCLDKVDEAKEDLDSPMT
ncbi:MAG: response regulator [Legionellales bacterium]|nr:response regulator [Legionellales bacterium]